MSGDVRGAGPVAGASVSGTSGRIHGSKSRDEPVSEHGEGLMIGGTADPVGRAQEQLRRLFPDDPEHTAAIAWARETLHSSGLDPDAAPLRSLRALRRADVRLDAVTARYLVEIAAGKPVNSRRPGLNPHLE